MPVLPRMQNKSAERLFGRNGVRRRCMLFEGRKGFSFFPCSRLRRPPTWKLIHSYHAMKAEEPSCLPIATSFPNTQIRYTDVFGGDACSISAA